MTYRIGQSNVLLFLLVVFVAAGCATTSGPTTLSPEQINPPKPIENNTGKWLSPYTSDGVVAEWVVKGRNAKLGANVGGMVGREVGARALESVPLVGGIFGDRVGKTSGRAIAVKMVGGEEYIRETSDLSFNELDELAVYMYVLYSQYEDYEDVLELTIEIYPELKERYDRALLNASEEQSLKD